MKHSILCLVALATLAATRSFGGSTAWSAPASIDFREDNARRVAPVAIPYSPDFVAGGNAADGKVELLRISHYDTFRPSTNTLVSTSAASAIGAAMLTGVGAHHLVLRSFDSNDALVGEISADVGLGVDSGFVAETLADMEDDKLDRAVRSGERPGLAYSDKWVAGAASLAIDHNSGSGSFNTLFSANAPADGTYSFNPTAVKRTTGTVRLHFYDADGDEIGLSLVASYSGVADLATIMYFR